MTISLNSAGSGGLMNIQGKAFHAIDTLNTARLTTVPTEVSDFLVEWEGLTGVDLDYQAYIQGIASASSGWQSSGSSLASSIRTACVGLLSEAVNDDNAQPDRTLKTALKYLIAQMEDNGSYVDANVVALTLTADSTNDNDLAIVYTSKRGDGREQENMLAESIDIEVTTESAVTPTLRLRGEVAQGEMLSYLWPLGSGFSRSITATDAASSLIANGDFEDTTIVDTPDNWIIAVGTPSKTIAVSDAEVQTIAISGTPSGGHYSIRWTNAAGVTRTTASLAYNASASSVQTALRTLPGLGAVTVAATGTSPNLTHTVTFTGLAGNLSEMTSVVAMTGGTGAAITHATTSEGDGGAMKGRALQIISDGTGELTEILQPISGLAAETVYFCHFRIKRYTPTDVSSESSSSSASQSSWSASSSSSSSSSVASETSSTAAQLTSDSTSSQSLSSSSSSSVASESSSESASVSSSSQSSSSTAASETSSSSHDLYEMRVEVIDGIGGSRTTDGEGNDNEIRVDIDAVSNDTHDSKWFSFRLQRSVADPVYLRIRMMRQLPKYDVIYIDEMAVVEATELYAGGPLVAAFSGINDVSLDDGWTLASTNSRAGEFQTWYNRVYSMAAKGLLLPSSGTTLIPDSLIG